MKYIKHLTLLICAFASQFSWGAVPENPTLFTLRDGTTTVKMMPMQNTHITHAWNVLGNPGAIKLTGQSSGTVDESLDELSAADFHAKRMAAFKDLVLEKTAWPTEGLKAVVMDIIQANLTDGKNFSISC